MRLLVGVFTLLISVSAIASPEKMDLSKMIQLNVEKYTLDNGLTVILHEDHTSPLVSFHQWFRVGSVNEKPGKTGLAHFFEHYMFKGTKKVSEDRFWKNIHSVGGNNNAFTSRDYTGYYADVPSSQLEMIMSMEADRMEKLIFDPTKIKAEREVVKEERRMRVENSVRGSMQEAVFKTVFKTGEYRWPVIGYMKDLNSASIDDFKAFYNKYYSPNNAVIVVTGDFKTSKAKSLIKKYYGHMKKSDIPALKYSKEPEQKYPREVKLKKNVQSHSIAVAYKMPKLGTYDSYVFDVLSEALGGGESSRLYKKMVYRQQVASSAYSWTYPLRESGLFQVSVNLKPEKDANKALTTIYSELYKLRTTKMTDKELEKIKNNVRMSFVSSLKTIPGKAYLLAFNEVSLGDYSKIYKDIEVYDKITAEDVQRVAQEYLTPQKRSTVFVEPKQ